MTYNVFGGTLNLTQPMCVCVKGIGVFVGRAATEREARWRSWSYHRSSSRVSGRNNSTITSWPTISREWIHLTPLVHQKLVSATHTLNWAGVVIAKSKSMSTSYHVLILVSLIYEFGGKYSSYCLGQWCSAFVETVSCDLHISELNAESAELRSLT